MIRLEFMQGIHLLKTAIGKEPKPEQVEVYWQVLQELPGGCFRAGCLKVLAEHVWNTFPSIAELFQAARHFAAPTGLTAAEAFAIAQKAATLIDPELTGPHRVKVGGEWREYSSQAEYVFDRLKVPPAVRKAIETFGVEALCSTTEPIGVTRAQFAKTFDQLTDRERRQSELPGIVRQVLEAAPAAAIGAKA